MDASNWDATPMIGSGSSSWKNQQQQIKESLMMFNSYRFAPESSRVNSFNPIQQQIANGGSSECHDIGDSSASLAMNIQEFGAAFDPIHILSSWKISQRQEAATRLAADSAAAKSGAGSIGDCTKSKMGSPSSSFPPQNSYMPHFGNNQFADCGLMADLGSNGLFSKSRSPDCLLSATNTSNTDTSVENDGISVIFSNDSKTLWNIKTDNNTVSSGESAIDAFNSNPSKHCNMAKRNHDHALLEPDSSTKDSRLIEENVQPKSKKSKSEYKFPSSSNINFQQACSIIDEPDSEAIAQMKEMIYHAAAFRPMSSVDKEVLVDQTKPRRKNVRISTDPQTAAARRRRERISERIRTLQKLVPGGTKMDTASMLDEAANYLKFLRTQVNVLEAFGYKIDPIIINNNFTSLSSIVPFSYPFPMQPHFPNLQNLNPIHRPKC
ncbi:hypothetical protein HAX54_038202 [Datura stramonium]|uniref:BHLH domain-containing protein n=1 Tax=Datura stramonium TaxID=4076 RepID=A0ABS8RNG7_DATST|nr:hypothetical protein [Datura stramonium]